MQEAGFLFLTNLVILAPLVFSTTYLGENGPPFLKLDGVQETSEAENISLNDLLKLKYPHWSLRM
jgi:hypothetical protein